MLVHEVAFVVLSSFSVTTLFVVLFVAWGSDVESAGVAAVSIWVAWALLWIGCATAAYFMTTQQFVLVVGYVRSLGMVGPRHLLLMLLILVAARKAFGVPIFDGLTRQPILVGVVAAFLLSPWLQAGMFFLKERGDPILHFVIQGAALAAWLWGCLWVVRRPRVAQFAEASPQTAWLALAAFFTGKFF